LFDLGVGRALTQLVAKKLGRGGSRSSALVWTSLVLMLLLGAAGALTACCSRRGWCITRSMCRWLQAEPCVLLRAGALDSRGHQHGGLRGLLEAHQRFGMINALRIPMGLYSFASPLLVLRSPGALLPVVAVLVCGRVIGGRRTFCFACASCRNCGRGSRGMAVQQGLCCGWRMDDDQQHRESAMVTLDRFVIGALASMTAVAYYATPYELVTKLWLIRARWWA